MNEIKESLKNGHHILTKNYHDGHGRQFWLRNEKQETIKTLSDEQFRELRPLLKCESVMSSDEAFWCELL